MIPRVPLLAGPGDTMLPTPSTRHSVHDGGEVFTLVDSRSHSRNQAGFGAVSGFTAEKCRDLGGTDVYRKSTDADAAAI